MIENWDAQPAHAGDQAFCAVAVAGLSHSSEFGAQARLIGTAALAQPRKVMADNLVLLVAWQKGKDGCRALTETEWYSPSDIASKRSDRKRPGAAVYADGVVATADKEEQGLAEGCRESKQSRTADIAQAHRIARPGSHQEEVETEGVALAGRVKGQEPLFAQCAAVDARSDGAGPPGWQSLSAARRLALALPRVSAVGWRGLATLQLVQSRYFHPKRHIGRVGPKAVQTSRRREVVGTSRRRDVVGTSHCELTGLARQRSLGTLVPGGASCAVSW
jgi:hypothetical protein